MYLITLRGDAKFKGNLTCGWKNDITNLISFHEKVQKSFDAKNGAKFEEKLTLCSRNGITNLVDFNVNSGKSENLHFDVLLF